MPSPKSGTVTDKIGDVGFYDTGFVGADEFDLTGGDWHAGAGLGLRYDTGIGPIRESLIGMVEQRAAHRERWLEKMFAFGKKAC